MLMIVPTENNLIANPMLLCSMPLPALHGPNQVTLSTKGAFDQGLHVRAFNQIKDLLGSREP